MSIITRDSSREALTWFPLRLSTADRSIMRVGYGSLMRRNVLITGGAGFIGSHLASWLDGQVAIDRVEEAAHELAQPGTGVMSGTRGYSKSVHALEPAGAA